MIDSPAEIYARLDEMGIAYDVISHDPVFSMQDCAAGDARLNATTAKNYFLATKHRDRFYLCIVRPNARFKSVDISRQIGSTRLSFAPEEDLLRLLHAQPGAVSPMGLIFDRDQAVCLLVDEALTHLDRIAFHPCDNTQTLAMSAQDFFNRFLPAVAHEPRLVQIHDFDT